MKFDEIEDYEKAGRIASEVKQFALSFIKPEMPLLEIAEKIEGRILELKGKPAFPVNLSINEIAAHYTPSANDETKAEGLLKVDLGVSVNGYIADLAFSIDLTPDNEHKKMIELNNKALENVLKSLKPGMKVNEIAEYIQKTIANTEYSVIVNLSGHSLDKETIHAGLTISNYLNNNTEELKEIAVAIEPFLTKGSGFVYEGKPSEIYKLENPGNVRDNDARKLLLFIIDKYKTMPFCKRWLEKEKFQKLNFSLSCLVKAGILHNYPVLVERDKKPVSQSEATALILEDKVIITTK